MRRSRNEPNVHLVEELPNGAALARRGAVRVTILGNWQYYRAKIHRQDTPTLRC